MAKTNMWDIVIIVCLMLVSIIIPYFLFTRHIISKTVMIVIWCVVGAILLFVLLRKSFFGFMSERKLELKKYVNVDEAKEAIKKILYESNMIRGNEIVDKTMFGEKVRVFTKDIIFSMNQSYHWLTSSGMPKVVLQAEITSPRMYGTYVFDLPLGYGIDHIKHWNFKALRANMFNYHSKEKRFPSSLPMNDLDRRINMLANLPNANPDVIQSALTNTVSQTPEYNQIQPQKQAMPKPQRKVQKKQQLSQSQIDDLKELYADEY